MSTTAKPKPSKKRYDEDLFKETTMTFGEHLEELRSCLWKAVISLALGFVIGLFMGERVMLIIAAPLTKALEVHYLEQATIKVPAITSRLREQGYTEFEEEKILAVVKEDRLLPELRYAESTTFGAGAVSGKPRGLIAAEIVDTQAFCRAVEDSKNSLGQHIGSLLEKDETSLVHRGASQELSESEREQLATALGRVLRNKNFYRPGDYSGEAFAKILAEQDELTPLQFHRRLLAAAFPQMIQLKSGRATMFPLILWQDIVDDPRLLIKTMNAQEGFMIYLKASLVFGAILGSPFIFYYLWSFVAAGLYPHERHYVYIFLPISLFLFLSGIFLTYFFVFKPVLGYLLEFNTMMGMEADIRVSEWLGFAIMLPLGFGIAFQLPLVMFFLERIGIFTIQAYLSKWKVAILVIFFIAMVLTPAEPISMLLMAVPLTGLYFLGVGMCKAFPRQGPQFD